MPSVLDSSIAGPSSPSAPSRRGLLVFEEHPVQYRAPLYRYLQQELGIPVKVI
jgi:hypothetical protein